MDDNKKLEDFFRNRINDLDAANDGWDKPDAAVFENAQNHFPEYPVKQKRNRKTILLILMGIALLSLLTYIWYLEKEMVTVESQLQIAETSLQESQEHLAKEQERFSKTSEVLEKDNKAILKKTKQIETQNKSYEQTIESLKKQQIKTYKSIGLKDIETDQLIQQNKIIKANLDKQLATQYLNPFDPQLNTKPLSSEHSKHVTKLFPIASRNLEPLNVIKKDIELIMPSFVPVVRPKSRKKKIEIGLYMSSLNYEIPIAYEFSKFESIEKKGVKGYPMHLVTPRLHLAYAIRSDLWLTTGFRKASINFDKKFSSKLIYDDAGEYVNDAGETINEFVINTQSAFNEVENKISLNVPADTDIASGDILEGYWTHIQKYQFINIPFGIAYYKGKEKLQWHVKGGLGWNKVSIGNYFIEGKFKYKNEDFSIDNKEEIKSVEKSIQYLNGYAGLGLNYKLTENWLFRISFIAERNFIESKTQFDEDLTTNHLDNVLEIGLNYRW